MKARGSIAWPVALWLCGRLLGAQATGHLCGGSWLNESKFNDGRGQRLQIRSYFFSRLICDLQMRKFKSRDSRRPPTGFDLNARIGKHLDPIDNFVPPLTESVPLRLCPVLRAYAQRATANSTQEKELLGRNPDSAFSKLLFLLQFQQTRYGSWKHITRLRLKRWTTLPLIIEPLLRDEGNWIRLIHTYMWGSFDVSLYCYTKYVALEPFCFLPVNEKM